MLFDCLPIRLPLPHSALPTTLSLVGPEKPNSRPKAQVSVLDSLTMEWIQPKIRGDPIGVRTRHTAVAVHADYEQHERGEAEAMCMQYLNFVCSTGSLFFPRCVLGVTYVCRNF